MLRLSRTDDESSRRRTPIGPFSVSRSTCSLTRLTNISSSRFCSILMSFSHRIWFAFISCPLVALFSKHFRKGRRWQGCFLNFHVHFVAVLSPTILSPSKIAIHLMITNIPKVSCPYRNPWHCVTGTAGGSLRSIYLSCTNLRFSARYARLESQLIRWLSNARLVSNPRPLP